ncbi:chromosome partitioning protein ParA [Reticulomyxa filosa]|uniref:Chromosome partitioning protein ParA n=1 Tax=Reticulomyxa filosa TaxID=46433 RepID=X6LKK7_RETFI|nr:chromosome partitioning protein ParA [Reticulomyxa filosa]|eukprot:ETO01260.1 chromosome partitioning protein ParA [Reticulomyxa filosa]
MKLFDIKITKTTLYNHEATGEIPSAQRLKVGKQSIRGWRQVDLPFLGEKYGFLDKSLQKKKKIISIYTPKGGVLKSTLAMNFSRILALHNIKTLVIGLDIQGTITEMFNQAPDINEENIDILDKDEKKDLYLLSHNQVQFSEIVNSTDIPTLFYIPETPNLVFLEQRIREQSKREFFFERLLKSYIECFDVIIFDNAPNWNYICQNSLSLATDVLSPISCEVNTYYSLAQNVRIIEEYKSNMNLKWDNFILIPTKVNNTVLCKEIETRYRNDLRGKISTSSIRSATIGEQGSLAKLSAIEISPTSNLALDYKELFKEIWKKLN